MPEKIKSAIPRLVFKASVFVVFTITSAFLILSGFDTVRELHFGYKEQGNIDYAVSLKGDNFLGENTAAAGETYYSDLIENINAKFKYGADFTEAVSGKYNYQFVATVRAQKDNGDDFWTKSYDITEPSAHELKDSRKLRINATQVINYQKYNQILRDFSEEYQQAATGTLQVSMIINGEFQAEIMDKPATLDSAINFEIPLARDSVNVTVKTNTDNNGKIYTKKISIDDDNHRFSRITGMFLAGATVYLVICQALALRRDRNAHRFEYTVTKLRDEYDDIIVDIKGAPKIKGLNVTTVQAFDELLDVYNSVKMPINYYEAKDGAHFILISGKLAWQYVMKESDFIEKPASKRRAARRPRRKK